MDELKALAAEMGHTSVEFTRQYVEAMQALEAEAQAKQAEQSAQTEA